MDFGLLVLEDWSKSFRKKRAYLIEVKIHIIENIMLNIVREQYYGPLLYLDISRVKEGIVEGIDERWYILQRVSSYLSLIEDNVQ